MTLVQQLEELNTVPELQARIKSQLPQMGFQLAKAMKPLTVYKPTQLLPKAIVTSGANLNSEAIDLIKGRARMFVNNYDQPEFLLEFAKFQEDQAAAVKG